MSNLKLEVNPLP